MCAATNLHAAATSTIAAEANGRMQGIVHPAQPQPWWRKHFQWERNLTVAGRIIEKGWVVSQGMGIALIVVMLGGVGGLYWRIIDKQAEAGKETQSVRELLIRLDQRLIDKNEHDSQRFQQIEQRITDTQEHQAAVETVTNKEISQLKAKRN